MASGITASNLGPPDHDKALQQFEAYVDTLRRCGLSVTVLEPLEGFPDAHFVEDAAVVLPEIAVLTRSGARARRGEVETVANVLSAYRKTAAIVPPGTLDGGDVLMVDNHIFIGLSERTNEFGARQLGNIVSSFGYTWTTVPVEAGLHFKSSVNSVGDKTLLTTSVFSDHPSLSAYERIVLAKNEEYAGNTLLINDHLIMPSGYTDTKEQLQRLNKSIIEVDMSEFRKMDGGLTCLSLRF
jgi:dimethylargininase